MEEIQTGVREYTSKKWNKYWFGVDKKTNKKVTMFKNNKKWENQPDFNIIVKDGDEDYKPKKEEKEKEEDINVDDDLPF